MPLTITESPTRTVNGIESNLTALKSQIPFKFLREDGLKSISIPYLGSIGDNVTINFGDGDELAVTKAGDLFYIDFPNTYEPGIYTAIGSPLNIQPGAWQVEIDLTSTIGTDIDNVPINYISLRTNYNVSVNFFSNVTNSVLLTNPIRYVPEQNGNLFIDLVGLFFGFQPFIGFSDFAIIYAESYGGVDQPSAILGDFAGLPAKKQFLNDGGANMWEYLPNQQDAKNVVKVRKQTTGGNIAIEFDSLNTTFVTNEYVTLNIGQYNLTAKVTFHDVASVVIVLDSPFMGVIEAGAGQVLGTAHRPGGLFLTDFKKPVQWLYYKKQISWFFDINALTRNGGVSIDLFVEGFDASGGSLSTDLVVETTQGLKTYDLPATAEVSYYEIELRGGPGQANVLSEKITIKQKPACVNPILIEWQNRQGAWEQYNFNYNQNVEDITSEGLVTESPITETLDLVNTTIQRLPIDNSQQLTLLADSLDKSTFEALKYLKASEKVFVYLDPLGTKKISVAVVGSLNTSSETNTVLNDFRVKVQFPPDFKIENI